MNLLTDLVRSAAREVGRQIARDLYRAAVAEVSRALPGSARRQPTPRPSGVRTPRPRQIAEQVRAVQTPGGWLSLPVARCMFVPAHAPHPWRTGDHDMVLCRG